MKSKIKVLEIILITAVIGIFAACKDEPNPAPIPTPQPQPQSGLEEYTPAIGGVKVFLDGVSKADAATAYDRIKDVYDGFVPGQKTKFADGRITSINIVPGNTVVMDGSVAKIGSGASLVTIGNFLDGVVAYLQQFDNSKETIRMAFTHVRGTQGGTVLS